MDLRGVKLPSVGAVRHWHLGVATSALTRRGPGWGKRGEAAKREKAGLRTAGGDGEQLAPGAWYAPAGRGRRRALATHLPVLLLVGQRQPWHVPHEVLPLPLVLVRGHEDDLQAVRGLWLSGRARPRPGPRPSGRVPSQAAVEGGQAGAELRAGGAQAAPEVEPQQRDAAGSQRVHVHLLAAARHQLVAQQLLQEARHPGPPQPRHAGGREGRLTAATPLAGPRGGRRQRDDRGGWEGSPAHRAAQPLPSIATPPPWLARAKRAGPQQLAPWRGPPVRGQSKKPDPGSIPGPECPDLRQEKGPPN